MSNKLLLCLLIVLVAKNSHSKKCGIEASNCQFDKYGQIVWGGLTQECSTLAICGKGLELATATEDGVSVCCCKNKDKTTMEPTPSDCIPVSCRNRYIWLQEMCSCVCPPMYCEPGLIHGNDCNCIPDPNPGPPSDPEPSPTDDCSFQTCDYNRILDSNCNCVCDRSYPCNGANEFFDDSSCQCLHGDPCWVFAPPCPTGEIMNKENCACEPDPSYSTSEPPTPPCGEMACVDNKVLDKSCNCVCDRSYPCDGKNEFYDDSACQCLHGDPCWGECPYGELWNTDTCSCDIDPSPSECAYQECPPYQTWFPSPVCQCFRTCDYIMVCDPGFMWDFDVCGCIVDKTYTSPSFSCPTDIYCNPNSVLNPNTCSCDCTLQESDCTGPRTFFNNDMCECLRYPCDPIPCENPNEIIDYEICGCVPDPNYSTTKSDKSDSKSCSKESSHEHKHDSKEDKSKAKKKSSEKSVEKKEKSDKQNKQVEKSKDEVKTNQKKN